MLFEGFKNRIIFGLIMKNAMPLQEESIFVPLSTTDTLHIKRFYENAEGEPVFMIHGSIENGKIFYSKSGKGYAPYMASQGYDVFVVDLQGRGESTPTMNKNSHYGQLDVIKTDMPACIKKIQEKL